MDFDFDLFKKQAKYPRYYPYYLSEVGVAYFDVECGILDW